MRKVKLYIAASLDSFIARPNGSVDWLESLPNPNQIDHGYADFCSGIDTTLMGYQTYQEILNFDIPFPYPDKQNFVFTRNPAHGNTEYVTFIKHSPTEFVKDLKAQSGKDIWLIGGGQINTLLLNHGLIDEIQLSIAPMVLGAGIPLFASDAIESHFTLVNTETFETGIVQLTLSKK